jgi:16S rRNA (guanine966-N2)-methyltransferase
MARSIGHHKTEIRIVAGSLRRRRLAVHVHPGLRPTPQRVRESLFSILGNAVPERPFFDVFAGTGINGLEALSRGASRAVFVERDFRLADDIQKHLAEFRVADRGQVVRGDVYRWAERWQPPTAEPLTAFLSPPFADLTQRAEGFLDLVRTVRERSPAGSVVAVQAEEGFPAEQLGDLEEWDVRRYGRNMLLFWVKPTDEQHGT